MAGNKKRKSIITYIAVGVIFAGVIAAALIFGHDEKIPDNPAETYGNTAGNLNNGGLFCESGGVVYFANPNDSFSLYSMNPDNTNVTKLSDVPVSYINAGGDYLYFYYNDRGGAKFMGLAGNMRGVYRIPKSGRDTPTCLDRTTSGVVLLMGNNIYYQHYDKEEALQLYYCKTDGSDKGLLVDEIINPACAVHSNIYYSDYSNKNYLSVLNPLNGSKKLYLDARVYNPIAENDYIYFMNVDDDYKLYRYNMLDGSTAKITNERIDAYNVYGSFVFYQTNSKSRPRLVRMMSDGSNPEIIAEGNYTDINCTSAYTYFRPYDEENVFYMTPTTGYVSASSFSPVTDE